MELLSYLQEKLPVPIVVSHDWRGDVTIVVAPESLPAVATFVADDPELGMDVLVDCTAVDLLPKTPRFEVVYHFLNYETSLRLRVKVALSEAKPVVPTLSGAFKSANWMEREVYDLYGILFEGHPDLRRILLYPEFEGHPLRKDYAKEHEQPRVELRSHRHWKEPPPEGVS